MTKREFFKLPIGLYIIYWKAANGGGFSLASTGVPPEGGRWFAPTNWVAPSKDTDRQNDGKLCKWWLHIESAFLICQREYVPPDRERNQPSHYKLKFNLKTGPPTL